MSAQTWYALAVWSVVLAVLVAMAIDARRKERRSTPTPLPRIVAGQQWRLTGTPSRDPFPSKEAYPPVTILDARDGWVRYAMHYLFTDERMDAESFVRMYTLVRDVP